MSNEGGDGGSGRYGLALILVASVTQSEGPSSKIIYFIFIF